MFILKVFIFINNQLLSTTNAKDFNDAYTKQCIHTSNFIKVLYLCCTEDNSWPTGLLKQLLLGTVFRTVLYRLFFLSFSYFSGLFCIGLFCMRLVCTDTILTSTIIFPTFVTKVTENLCSGWFFFFKQISTF